MRVRDLVAKLQSYDQDLDVVLVRDDLAGMSDPIPFDVDLVEDEVTLRFEEIVPEEG